MVLNAACDAILLYCLSSVMYVIVGELFLDNGFSDLELNPTSTPHF